MDIEEQRASQHRFAMQTIDSLVKEGRWVTFTFEQLAEDCRIAAELIRYSYVKKYRIVQWIEPRRNIWGGENTHRVTADIRHKGSGNQLSGHDIFLREFWEGCVRQITELFAVAVERDEHACRYFEKRVQQDCRELKNVYEGWNMPEPESDDWEDLHVLLNDEKKLRAYLIEQNPHLRGKTIEVPIPEPEPSLWIAEGYPFKPVPDYPPTIKTKKIKL